MTIPPITMPSVLPQRPDAPRPMFNALAISASGLTAQRVRMDVIAQNLANAETTRTPEGGPYRRHVVNLEAIEPETVATVAPVAPTLSTALAAGAGTTGSAASAASAATNAAMSAAGIGNGAFSTPVEMADDTGGVRVASIQEDQSDGPMVYNPGSPDADQSGYVHMPNVNMTDEMLDLMNARRVYEANATVFQVARAMLHKAIDI